MKKLFNAVLIFLSISAFAQEVTKQYDKIGHFDQGVAIVWKAGHCGLITQGGKEVIPPIYDKISGFGRDAIAYSTKDGLIGLIDIQGKILVPNIYSYIGPFRGFYAITRKNGLAGMINKHGKVVIDNKYEDIRVEDHGIIRGTKDGKQVILEVKE